MLQWDALKDPDEIKDYSLDWSEVLEGGDTLIDSEWTVTSGDNLTIVSQPYTSTHSIVWLSGGETGTYHLLNRVETFGGRIYDQTVKLKVKSK
jgi:hypothetical protein